MKLKVGKKTGLKYFNLSDINGWSPCYDPTRYLSKDFRGTALDILTNGNIPLQDRLWAVLRTAVISEKTLRLFAVWSARQVQHLNTDPRVEACLKTVEEFIAGTASLEQMRQARSGAGNAAAYAADAAYAAYAAAPPTPPPPPPTPPTPPPPPTPPTPPPPTPPTPPTLGWRCGNDRSLSLWRWLRRTD
jgi:hypothetical protein